MAWCVTEDTLLHVQPNQVAHMLHTGGCREQSTMHGAVTRLDCMHNAATMHAPIAKHVKPDAAACADRLRRTRPCKVVRTCRKAAMLRQRGSGRHASIRHARHGWKSWNELYLYHSRGQLQNSAA